jgi:hypothetical protein
VGEIAGGHHGDALALRPRVQMLQVQLAAGRTRQVRVDMEIRHERHGENLARLIDDD